MKGNFTKYCFSSWMQLGRLVLILSKALPLASTSPLYDLSDEKVFFFFVQACASLEPNYQPPVTFIVVQKRHHTRLFANNHKDRSSIDRSGNILPGKLSFIFAGQRYGLVS